MLAPFLLSTMLGLSQAQAQPAPKPEWIETLPEVPGRLYALGTADLSGTESQALARASDRARLEVVARLRSTVKGETATVTKTTQLKQSGAPATGFGEREVRDEVKVGAQAEDLPGLVVERTHVDAAARTAYALAYLDVAQARSTLAARLGVLAETRKRVGDELSRKARWRLRGLQSDLGRLDELSGLLASTGALDDFRASLLAERQAVDQRLAQLNAANLPPLDLAGTTMTLRTNVDLPGGIQDYLEARMAALGPKHRDAGADFVLDLAFPNPQFIFSEMTFADGVIYRLEAQMRILDASGTALTKPAAFSFAQAGNADGLVDQFRRAFDRRLGRLLDELQSELQ